MSIVSELLQLREPVAELAEAIKQSSEYRDFAAAEAAVFRDSSARALLQELVECRERSAFESAAVQRFQAADSSARQNETMQEYFRAQENLAALCRGVAGVIDRNLEFDFAAACLDQVGGS